MQAIFRHLAGRARAAAITAIGAAFALVLLTLGSDTGASAAPTATASKSVNVSIKGFKFKPGTINIDKGDRVVWTNFDSVKHTATRGGSFTTGKIKPGHAAAVKFTAKGTYGYICTLHPGMRGKVVVG
jgi:plastocyanin